MYYRLTYSIKEASCFRQDPSPFCELHLPFLQCLEAVVKGSYPLLQAFALICQLVDLRSRRRREYICEVMAWSYWYRLFFDLCMEIPCRLSVVWSFESACNDLRSCLSILSSLRISWVKVLWKAVVSELSFERENMLANISQRLCLQCAPCPDLRCGWGQRFVIEGRTYIAELHLAHFA